MLKVAWKDDAEPTLLESQWLEGETARFNTAHAKREPGMSVIDFLRNAAKRAGVIYDRAASELARQVWPTVGQQPQNARNTSDSTWSSATLLESVQRCAQSHFGLPAGQPT